MAKKTKGVHHIQGDIYRIDYQVAGNRNQQWIKATSLKEAKIIRAEHIVGLRKQMPVPENEQSRFNATFEEVWGKLHADLQADGLPRKTFLRYRKVFERVCDFRNKKYPHIKSVSQVTLPFLTEYRGYFVNTLKRSPNGGLRAELIVLKAMLRRLKRLGFCDKTIIESLDELKRPKGGKKMYPNITNSQIKNLLNYINKNKPCYYYPIYFMCRTGRRVEETTLIERRDIVWAGLNPSKINIRPETTKTKEETPLERIDEDLAKVMKEAYNFGSKHKTVYLFCNNRGKKCSSRTLLRHLSDVSQKIIGIKITPHYFRHRFLTECGKANVPLIDTMNIAGIKDTNVVTKYYSHTTTDGQDKVLAVTRV
ncbi:MAG: site-specific integrase [Candidatus Omnitrophica bacterium]|nr:site-specific integrase [Candidatus Omnitrophota bacterium]